MYKKSQITIFITLVSILLISAALIYYFRFIGAEKVLPPQLTQDVAPIKQYVESCIRSVGEEGLVLIGEQGGYFELPEYSTKNYSTKTAYYFYIDRNLMPSEETIENELSKYMNSELFFCLMNFVDFQKSGFTIERGDFNTTTTIRSNDVLFKVNFPITIKKQNTETSMLTFTNSVDNLRLSTIYNVSTSLMDDQMKDFNSVCVSCLIDLATENDLHISTVFLSNDTILFTITDNNSKINSEPYKFSFANKYQFNETQQT